MITPPWYETPMETLAFNVYAADLEDRIIEGIQTEGRVVDCSGLNELDADYVIRRIEEGLSKI